MAVILQETLNKKSTCDFIIFILELQRNCYFNRKFFDLQLIFLLNIFDKLNYNIEILNFPLVRNAKILWMKKFLKLF